MNEWMNEFNEDRYSSVKLTVMVTVARSCLALQWVGGLAGRDLLCPAVYSIALWPCLAQSIDYNWTKAGRKALRIYCLFIFCLRILWSMLNCAVFGIIKYLDHICHLNFDYNTRSSTCSVYGHCPKAAWSSDDIGSLWCDVNVNVLIFWPVGQPTEDVLFGAHFAARCRGFLLCLVLFMVALWNRADHYIFILSFVLLLILSFFFSSPNLSRHRLDVYHTSTHGVALVRI